MSTLEVPSRPTRIVQHLVPPGQNHDTTPWGLHWRSDALFIVIVIVIGMGIFSDVFLYALIVSVIPFVLRDRIGVDPAQLQNLSSFLISVCAFASVVVSPVSGSLADRLASLRQMPFLLSLSALIRATVLLAVADSVPLMTAARILQGASGAMVWTVGLAICLETIFAVVMAGTLFAPALGGILYEKTGYRGVFGVGVGVLVVDLILRFLVIEKKIARKYLDGQDQSGAPGSASFNEEEGTSTADAPAADEETMLVPKPIDSTYKFDPASSRLIRAVPAVACLKNPAFLVACVISFVHALYIASCDATVPLIAIEWYDFSPLRTGLLFLPICFTEIILGPLIGWAVDRFGTKPVSILGFSIAALGHFLLRIPRLGGTDQVAIYCVILAVCASGISFCGTIYIVEAGNLMERYYKANPELFGVNGHFAQLYGITSTFFSLGLTIGPLIAGYLKDSIGYGNMNTFLAGVSLLMVCLTAKFIGEPFHGLQDLWNRRFSSDADAAE